MKSEPLVERTTRYKIAESMDGAEQRFMAENSGRQRKEYGVTFTPQWVVDIMVSALALDCADDDLIIDAGAGAGRFALAAAQALPAAKIIAMERDTSLGEIMRGTINSERLGNRVSVLSADFLRVDWPAPSGRTIFLGNPPYVRHHSIAREDKEWLREAGRQLGVSLSGLSGLHVYFMTRCFIRAKTGDRLMMILPSEWLETAYGVAIKAAILARCAKTTFYLFPPQTSLFGATMTTSVIVDLHFGEPTGAVYAAVVREGADRLPRETRRVLFPGRTPAAANWIQAGREAVSEIATERNDSPGEIELGDLFKVHRGQVTGMNNVWIANNETRSLIPERYLFPTVTDAKEIIAQDGGVLDDASPLRRVIDLPSNLVCLESGERRRVVRFLALAESVGASRTYIAQHRRPWWSVRLREPPLIVMTYMARRPPRFALNVCGARMLNIAHGLYPKIPLNREQLMKLVRSLNDGGAAGFGRTYSGGLIKLEPGDAMRIRIPCLESGLLALAA